MKKTLLFICSLLLLLSCLIVFAKADNDNTIWFNDNDLVYQNVSIGMSYDELKNVCSLPLNELIIDANNAIIYFADFKANIYKDTVYSLSITNTTSNDGIFNIKIGDSLEEIKAKLPYELIERNDYGNLVQNTNRKNYGELVNFHDNDRYLGSTIVIYSSSGKTSVIIELDCNLTVESISYQEII